MGLLHSSIQTKLNFRFAFNLALALVVMVCSFLILFKEKDNNNSSAATSTHISKLVELSISYESTKESYISYINSFKSTDLDLFNQSLDKLKAQEIFLETLEVERSELKPNIDALQDKLRLSEQFFQNNIALVANLPSNELSQDVLLDSNAADFNEAKSIFANLIKTESENLEAQFGQTEETDQIVAYLILTAAIASLIMTTISHLKASADERKKVEHERDIAQVKHSAQAANSAKSEYLAMISHEIRTPMNGVLGMSNLLLQSDLNIEQKDYVNTIRHSAESLLKIVNDVLDFSKIEAGKLSLANIPISVKSLVQDVLAILPPVSTHLNITHKIAKDVPEFINCDPVRLRQILINLLSNAIKFTPRGSVDLTCEVVENLEDGRLKLGFVVKDTGIGIPENKMAQLFKPFVQIERSTTGNYGGTGLGLNITYNLVTMMGGKIKAKSKVEQGSVFTFFIITEKVLKEDVVTVKPSNVNPEILDESLATDFPFKVLVVDDNEINLMLIMKTLSKLGYDCKKAINGEIALQLVKENHFDLIFMDMQMPVMDGPTATTAIRRFFKVYEYPVVIALTANTLGDNRDRCLEAGMQDFIAKPFKPVEIEEVIRKWAPKIKEFRIKNQINEV